MTLRLAVLLALASGVTGAQAQSFNCAYAKTPTEVLICENPELGRLDEEMAAAFYSLDGRTQRAERRRQSRFLAARDRCGYNFGCVAGVYGQRIETLYNLANDF